MGDVVSYLDSNKKKAEKARKLDRETEKMLLDHVEKFEKFRKLCDSDYWKECRDFIKDEIYQGLAINPGEAGLGDWWCKYVWGLKCFIERVESHAKKYDEAVKELSK